MTNLREKVLGILEENKGAYLSGEKIAETLGVSRAAVWKIIAKLRGDGYAIRSATNRGYALSAESDLLSAAGILRYIPAEYQTRYHINVFHGIDSTNNEARRRAAPAPVSKTLFGTVIIADSQDAGRGQKGSYFFSPAGGSIYLSFILPPIPNLAYPRIVTETAASAVCETIESFDSARRKPRIERVNDIFLDGKKVCGILTEAVINIENGEFESFMLGVGIYINVPDSAFPSKIRASTGSLKLLEGERNRFAAALIQNVFSAHTRLIA